MTIDTTRPALLGLLNHVAGASITPDTEASGHDGDELAVPSVSTSWRSTGVAAVDIDIDLGATQTDIDALALIGTNLGDAATVRVQVDDDPAFGTPDPDSGTVDAFDLSRPAAAGCEDAPPWGRPVLFIPSATAAGRYVRWTLTDTTNPAGYLEAHYAVVGPALQPGVLAVWSPGHALVGHRGSTVPLRRHDMFFRHVSDATRRLLQSVARAKRDTGRLVVVPHPGDPESWVEDVILARVPEANEEVPLPGRVWDITVHTLEVNT